MMKLFEMHYRGYIDTPSRCRVIFDEDNKRLVFVEELGNPGTTITNMIEHLATWMVDHLGIDTEGVEVFEVYEKKPRAYDSVNFSTIEGKLRNPMWAHATREGMKEYADLVRFPLNHIWEAITGEDWSFDVVSVKMQWVG